jgi:hypothetical protein
MSEYVTWGYRLFKFTWKDLGEYCQGQEYYGVFEVYFDNEGNIATYATSPVHWAESLEELQEDLQLLLAAATNQVPLSLKELNEKL